ncbi:MAG: nucleotidyltransferase, partial [Lachnospiraceae bacterium]|nr:nucleotidyltransferase [Lachnospiraceae bacterium]
MQKTALVIMAAGIGSRYGGGIKQCDGFGPSGEIMMEYSIRDALDAGFNKVVFIIRPDMDADFRKLIGDRISGQAEVAYAYQDLADLPEGYSVPEGRTKPWGTGQALLCAKNCVSEPFCVINADDYYGKESYRIVHEYLVSKEAADAEREAICMAGFVLGNTLSDNGGVTRGVCSLNEEGQLTGIAETKNIIKTDTAEGAAVMTDAGVTPLDKKMLV